MNNFSSAVDRATVTTGLIKTLWCLPRAINIRWKGDGELHVRTERNSGVRPLPYASY